MPTYTQLAQDLFLRPNESPLDPTKWTPNTSGEAALAIVSHLCVEATPPGDYGSEYYTGVLFPANQYAEIALPGPIASVLDTPSVLFHGTIDESNFSGVACQFVDGATILIVPVIAGIVGAGVSHTQPISGDIIRVEVLGFVGTIKYNGIVILTFDATGSAASGPPGISLSGAAAVSGFRAGSITSSTAYSVPDCRSYAIFPNNSRSVQDTLIYDVPAHPSYTPPVDSRTAGAPVDSRVSGIIPLNSRTPGTFGPGE